MVPETYTWIKKIFKRNIEHFECEQNLYKISNRKPKLESPEKAKKHSRVVSWTKPIHVGAIENSEIFFVRRVREQIRTCSLNKQTKTEKFSSMCGQQQDYTWYKKITNLKFQIHKQESK